jgi:hypothetical protein
MMAEGLVFASLSSNLVRAYILVELEAYYNVYDVCSCPHHLT